MPKTKEDQKTNEVDLSKFATTSAKIRHLTGLGWKRGDIAKHLGVRYQHVRNVQITPIKRVDAK